MGGDSFNGGHFYSKCDNQKTQEAHGVQDSFYKPLTSEQHAAAFRNEYDFDAPDAIDFDALVDRLQGLKKG